MGVITPFSLICAHCTGTGLDECYQMLKKAKKAKLPIVNKDFELVALIARSDIKKK